MTRSIKNPPHFRKLPDDARQYETFPTRLQALQVKCHRSCPGMGSLQRLIPVTG